MPVRRIKTFRIPTSEFWRVFAKSNQTYYSREHSAWDTRLIVPSSVQVTGVCRAIDPARIVGMRGMFGVRVIVQHAYLIAQVNQGDATGGHGDAVCEEDPLNCAVSGGFETGERGGGA